MKRLISIFLSLLLLCACAAKVEAPPETVPEPERLEEPAAETPAIENAPAQEDEISWEYRQLASYIRDALAVRWRETDVTLYFGPWEASRYENAPNLPEGMYFVRVAAEFASGDTAAGSFYAAWDEAAGVCDIFSADTYALLDGGKQFSFEYGAVWTEPEAVVTLTSDTPPIVPAYDPPAAEPVMPEATTYIPQSLVDAVTDAIRQ